MWTITISIGGAAVSVGPWALATAVASLTLPSFFRHLPEIIRARQGR